MTRGWPLLAVLGVVISAAGCGGHSPAQGGGGEAPPSPLPAQTAAHTPSASAASSTTGQTGAPGGPALAGSFLMDMAWVSDQRGWALAAAPCGEELCPLVAMTGDGGRTWRALPVPPGLTRNGVLEVSQIRFGSANVGYLFGPALFQTLDAGRTWHRMPGAPVEALEPSAGTVIRMIYDHGGCPGPCTRTVQRTTAGSGTWHTLLRLAPDPRGSAQVIRQGPSVIYIPLYGNLAAGAGSQRAVIFRSTDGGTSWQRLVDPCSGTGKARHVTTGLAAAPGGFLAALCLPRAGTDPTFVLTSDDYGSSWSTPRTIPGETRYNLGLIAAAGSARLVLSTGGVTGSGPFTYRLLVSTDRGLHWSSAVTGTTQINPQAPGPEFLRFEDTRVGRWISDVRHIWITRDGGRHWSRRVFP